MKRRKLSKAEREYRRGRRIFAYIAACASLVTALTGYISGLEKAGSIKSGIIQRINSLDPSDNIDVSDYSNTAVAFKLTESDGTEQQISIPQYDGTSLVYTVNNNNPYFTDADMQFYSEYLSNSPLDKYGRAGQADAVVSINTLRKGDRTDISDIHPSGWYEAKQSTVPIQRCHLIGSMIADGAFNTNDESGTNFVSGTASFNAGNKDVPGSMLDYEKMVIDCQEKEGILRYRVTPVFDGVDVTCHGVLMECDTIREGYDGTSVKFCVFIYNVEPGYVCNYLTGEWEEI